MLIGSFPIGKFTNPQRRAEIRPHEVDFFFGGERNFLWKILAEVFERPLRNREEIIAFLMDQKMGIGDLVASCVRENGRASDVSLKEIEWNHSLLDVLLEHNIRRLYFTSRQVETWFKRLFPDFDTSECVCLLSPSGQTARSIVRMPSYREWLKTHPDGRPYEFLVKTYKDYFNNSSLFT